MVYDRILTPTDGSNPSNRGVDRAIELAARFDSTVHALYVVDGSAYSTLEAGSEVVIDALEAEGEQATDRVADAAAAAGVETTTTVTSGTAYRAIREYADEQAVDMIVMGTHGRKGLDRYLLGSVTERVVRTADVPVLTVRQPTDE